MRRTLRHSNLNEYSIWIDIVRRCTDPRVASYARYGGRGITVCDRWRVFDNFVTDMGKRPSTQHTIERKNNSLGYSPDNCVWATKKEQARNRRNNRVVSFNGVTKCLSAHAEDAGLSTGLVVDRLKDGWSVERALTTPCLRMSNPKTVWITHDGITLRAVDWARKTGIPHSKLISRIKVLGWTHERAVTTK